MVSCCSFTVFVWLSEVNQAYGILTLVIRSLRMNEYGKTVHGIPGNSRDTGESKSQV